MLRLQLEKARNLLFLGAHSDDIEIGCGGTILKLAATHPELNVRWVVFSAEGKRAREARASAKLFLRGVKQSKVIVKKFRTSFCPTQVEAIKDYFETTKKSF